MNDQAIAIVQKHYGGAWRLALVARYRATNGRYTKAKERDQEIADAVSNALKEMVTELREAGYVVPD